MAAGVMGSRRNLEQTIARTWQDGISEGDYENGG
jgi:hypothetical protein